MSVSTDRPEEKAEALKFLEEKGATFPNFLFHDPDADRKMFERFEFEGGIPHMVVFSRTGTRVWAGTPKTDEELDQIVQRELDK